MLMAPVQAHRPQRPSAHARLGRLLAARIAPAFTLTHSQTREWASASFCGERHQFACQAHQPFDLADLRAALGQAEWRIAGHIVADVTVNQEPDGNQRLSVQIEVLTVED